MHEEHHLQTESDTTATHAHRQGCECDMGESAPATIDRRSVLRVGAAAGAVTAAASAGLLGASARQGAPSATSGARTGAANLAARLRWPIPPIITRAQWGMNESLRAGPPVFDTRVQKLVVHHAVTPNGYPRPASLVRNIATYHLSRGYIDIAYNFAIDHLGRIYEGRWAGNYASGAPHAGENQQGLQVRGAHAKHANDRTIGIVLLGTFTNQAPPAAMVNGLVELLAWKCARWAINPLGTSPYTTTVGSTLSTPNVIGHRAVTQTLCPGQPMLSLLPSVRTRVAQRIDAVAAQGLAVWAMASNGHFVSNGRAPLRSNVATVQSVVDAVDAARGVWVLAPKGRVVAAHGARHHGDLARTAVHSQIVAIAATVTKRGYYLVGNDGGVFTFGDARFVGSMGGKRLSSPVVGITPTRSGRGYWLLGRDGGVFSFGDAHFAGSASATTSDHAVSLIATATGAGYWIVRASGRIHAFGDARRAAFTRHAGAPLVASRRSRQGGLVGMAGNGVFVGTPSAPTIAPLTKRPPGAPLVALLGSL